MNTVMPWKTVTPKVGHPNHSPMVQTHFPPIQDPRIYTGPQHLVTKEHPSLFHELQDMCSQPLTVDPPGDTLSWPPPCTQAHPATIGKLQGAHEKCNVIAPCCMDTLTSGSATTMAKTAP